MTWKLFGQLMLLGVTLMFFSPLIISLRGETVCRIGNAIYRWFKYR